MQNQLISIIRNSLTAAQSALQALEYVDGNRLVASHDVVEAAPTPVQESPVNAAWPFPAKTETPETPLVLTPFGILMRELNDERYTLRSVSELRQKAGLDYDSLVFKELDNEDIDYVTKTRRRDGATLIGLSSRN